MRTSYLTAVLAACDTTAMALPLPINRSLLDPNSESSKCYSATAQSNDLKASVACEKLSPQNKRNDLVDADPEVSKCYADVAQSSDPKASIKCDKLAAMQKKPTSTSEHNDFHTTNASPPATTNHGACSTQIAQARPRIEAQCGVKAGAEVEQSEIMTAQACVKLEAPKAVEQHCRAQMVEESAKWVDEREKIGEYEAPEWDGGVVHVGGNTGA